MKKLVLFLFCIYLAAFAQKQSIDSAEYFIGNDPGEGKGTALNLSSLGDATIPISWSQLPGLGKGKSIYVRVKGSGFTDNSGVQVPGVWSLPMCVVYPIKNLVLQAAQAKIVRPGLSSPLWETVVAADDSFDNIIETIFVTIRLDSLRCGDTLQIRLQNSTDLWGPWSSILITPDMILSCGTGVIHGKRSITAGVSFVGSGLLNFTIAKPGIAIIEIYDLHGKNILVIARDRFYSTGRYSVDLRRFNISAGTYLCHFAANDLKKTVRFVLAR